MNRSATAFLERGRGQFAFDAHDEQRVDARVVQIFPGEEVEAA
jgi:hypothetical protein